jgi:hypothetical protein
MVKVWAQSPLGMAGEAQFKPESRSNVFIADILQVKSLKFVETRRGYGKGAVEEEERHNNYRVRSPSRRTGASRVAGSGVLDPATTLVTTSANDPQRPGDAAPDRRCTPLRADLCGTARRPRMAQGSITFASGSLSSRPRPGTVMLTAILSAVEAPALELAPVRVNAVTPSLMDTPLLHTAYGA